MKRGIRTRAGYVSRVEHLVAGPEPRGLRADLFHNPGGVEAKDARRAFRLHVSAHFDIDRIDRDTADFHKQVIRARLRHVRVEFY